eukprot:scaffold1113_cov379-Prasinococcus_capsulatus_cf.AAC.4
MGRCAQMAVEPAQEELLSRGVVRVRRNYFRKLWIVLHGDFAGHARAHSVPANGYHVFDEASRVAVVK